MVMFLKLCMAVLPMDFQVLLVILLGAAATYARA
jgi:hypothetical protein